MNAVFFSSSLLVARFVLIAPFVFSIRCFFVSFKQHTYACVFNLYAQLMKSSDHHSKLFGGQKLDLLDKSYQMFLDISLT
jgi:hypothetical protein